MIHLRPHHRPALLLALPALALAGCGSEVTLTNATIADVASASASLPVPQAGGWRSDTRLVSFDAGHDRTAAAAQIARHVGETVTTQACLAAADARRQMFGALSPAPGADCRFPHFRYTGGMLDAAMVCRNAAGATLSVTQKGRYAADAVDLVATVVRLRANGQADGGQRTRIVARHTGDCPDDAG